MALRRGHRFCSREWLELSPVLFIPEGKASALKVLGVMLGFAGVLAIGAPSGEQLAVSSVTGVFYMVMGSLGLGSSFINPPEEQKNEVRSCDCYTYNLKPCSKNAAPAPLSSCKSIGTGVIGMMEALIGNVNHLNKTASLPYA